MGDVSSKPSSPNPSSTSTDPSCNSPQTHEPNWQTDQTHLRKPEDVEAPATKLSDLPKEEPPADMEVRKEGVVSEKEEAGGEEGGEGEEEGECAFCLYMKGGGCKEAFVEWENCVKEGEENEKDIVEKCFEVILALKMCMEAHMDYYGALLLAEKAAEEEVKRKLEAEKAKEKAKDAGIDELLEEKGKGEGIDEEKTNFNGSDAEGDLIDDKENDKRERGRGRER